MMKKLGAAKALERANNEKNTLKICFIFNQFFSFSTMSNPNIGVEIVWIYMYIIYSELFKALTYIYFLTLTICFQQLKWIVMISLC